MVFKRFFSSAAIVLAVILFCGSLDIAVLAESFYKVPTSGYSSVYGGTVSLSAGGKKAMIVVYGHAGSTSSVMNAISESEWGKSKELKVIFADAGMSSKETVKSFAEAVGGGYEYCYDTGTGINGDMWGYARQIGLQNSLTLPVVVIFDSSDNVRYIHSGGIGEYEIISEIEKFTQLDYYREPTLEIPVSGTDNYPYAYKVFEMVNSARAKKGLPALTLDTKLMAGAMQRASDLAICYSHTRPDGSDKTSVFGSANIGVGENIASGYISPEAVMDGWMNSSGHYANIMGSGYKSIGIGCVEVPYNGGTRLFWVQLFSFSEGDGADRSRGTVNSTRTVRTKLSNLDLKISVDKSSYQVNIKNDGYAVPASLFSFKSSNTKAATVSSAGRLTVKGAGTTTLTAALKSVPEVSLSTEFTVTAPKKVTGAGCTQSGKKVRLSWSMDSSADGYQIQLFKNNKWTAVKTIDSNRTNYITYKLTAANKTYKFRVRAYKIYNGKKVYGSFSDVIKVRV